MPMRIDQTESVPALRRFIIKRYAFLPIVILCLSDWSLVYQAKAQDSQAVKTSDQELERNLEYLRQQIDDPKNDLPQRESFAMELAATLDRAAQASRDPESQRRIWNEAIKAIDEFERKNPGHPQTRQFQLQAAVYRWAIARGLRRQMDLSPTQANSRSEMFLALDDAIGRLRSITVRPNDDKDTLENNLKYRFAQALADRAELESDISEKKRLESEAKALIAGPLAATSIQGFAYLLEGELLRRDGQYTPALERIEAAVKSTPPPPGRQVLEVRTSILIGMKRYEDALAAIRKSPIEESSKRLMSVYTLLAQRASLAPDADRYPVDSKLFEEIGAMKAQPGPDFRLASLALARSRIDPDPRLGPNAWDSLADAQEAVGDSIRASGFEEKAAVRAEDSGHPDQAASYRLKAGALLFRSGKYLEAEAVLARVSHGKSAENSAVRAKASLLRAMSLGRAIATGIPGASAAAYKSALESHIKEFVGDPTIDEAYWLLGDILRAEAKLDRAASLWSAIRTTSPRWLESRRAIAALDRAGLMTSQPETDSTRLSARFRRAADDLDKSIQEAPNEAASTELLLDRAMLDLSPATRNSEEAREISERIARTSVDGPQRFRAETIRMVALAELGRYVEAELIARRISESTDRADPALILETIRLLDRSAVLSESDLRQRRFGLLMRMLLTPILSGDTSHLPANQVPELSMRLTRALIFVGDNRAAKGSIASWKAIGSIKKWDDNLLRDLADTYAQLDAYSLSIDVQRLRLKALASGSSAWFDAKYGLAVALYRSGKSTEAAQLIDATAILHPELGGHPLKEKFIRLRQRLGDMP